MQDLVFAKQNCFGNLSGDGIFCYPRSSLDPRY